MTLVALVLANLKMIVRNRQALFWALAFPLIFVVIFGLFFGGDERRTITIHVVDYAQDPLSQGLVRSLGDVETFEVREREDEAHARRDLRNGDLRYLLIIPEGLAESVQNSPPATITLVYDEGSFVSAVVIGVVQRFLDQVNLELAEAPTSLQLESTGTFAKRLDYFDFLLPGFVAMGIMTYAIIGLASEIAVYREQRILRRILATPLRVRTFFAAQVLAYLVLSLVQAAVILTAGTALFGGELFGNYAYIAVLVLLGNLAFLTIGFIVGSIAQNVQAASGMGNAVALPMMFLSGVFFDKEDLPSALGTAVEYLPLSPMLDALRGVALDARPLSDFTSELALLGAWIAVGSVVAVRVFKFN